MNTVSPICRAASFSALLEKAGKVWGSGFIAKVIWSIVRISVEPAPGFAGGE